MDRFDRPIDALSGGRERPAAEFGQDETALCRIATYAGFETFGGIATPMTIERSGGFERLMTAIGGGAMCELGADPLCAATSARADRLRRAARHQAGDSVGVASGGCRRANDLFVSHNESRPSDQVMWVRAYWSTPVCSRYATVRTSPGSNTTTSPALSSYAAGTSVIVSQSHSRMQT